jgi:hypothetical protein
MSTGKSRYDDFDTFLADVVSKAKERSDELKRVYDIKNLKVIDIVFVILTMAGGGWVAFLVITALCSLGVISFPVALAAFLSSPLGVLLGVVLLSVFGVGLGTSMWILYRDRKILMAIKHVGAKVKGPHAFLVKQHAEKSRFDRLFEEAVVALLVDPKEFYASRASWTEERISEKYNAK